MRSDLQDPFQKEFLQVKLSLRKTPSNFASSCQQVGELAPCELAACDLVLLAACSSSHPASSRSASWLAHDLRASELASSHLAARWQPCQLAGCLSSRSASWVLSPSNGLPYLNFKAI
ncbi:UNVERIFIED_CONTAM: hypothetical protein Sradi_6868300 [Sesamum radiatum]|uniref:Uncharacterized protein n=1 Tax=Sesamum radiatum TaxID=300843 RepID=A0AAW2JKF3_SESRA